MTYGVTEDYDYNETHKRHKLLLWSGPFVSYFEGEALSLPKLNGYMIETYNGKKIKVECPCPRDENNFMEVDKALSKAMAEHKEARA